jgi:hypothetical protein
MAVVLYPYKNIYILQISNLKPVCIWLCILRPCWRALDK